MKTNWTVIFIFLFGGTILLTSAAVLFIIVGEFKMWLKRKWYAFKKYMRKLKNEIKLTFRLKRFIKDDGQYDTIAMVFEAFVHFYETNFKDMEHWALPEEEFPNDTADLMHMYRWIKDIRPRNYAELTKLCYNYDKEYFEYWGARFQGFSFKIDPSSTLRIIPENAVHAVHPDHVFEKRFNQLQIALYGLDTTQSEWIIERRKYLGI